METKKEMRLDKFLKVSRLIKRRTVAHDICEAARVELNGRPAKPSSKVKPGDRLGIAFGGGEAVCVEILDVRESVRKEDASSLYRPIEK